MKRILIFFLSLYTTFVVAQNNVNYSQVLFDMLVQDECFKAWNYKQQYGDSIAPEVKLMYEYKMSGFLNKPDSSAFFFERMINECPIFFPNEAAKLNGINHLLGLYAEVENYEKVIELCHLAEDMFMNPPFNTDSVLQKSQLSILSVIKRDAEEKMKIPRMRATYITGQDDSVDIQKEWLITVPSECNGVHLNACIDTGWQSHLLMSKSLADKCKVSNVISLTDSLFLNGTLVRADMVLVDSLKIGSMFFENIPACIIYDKYVSFLPDSATLNSHQRAKYDSISTKMEFIVGLPLLKMMGEIEFDFQSDKMRVKPKSSIQKRREKPNIFIANQSLYSHLNINSIDFVGIVDTGAGNLGISLNPLFCNKYSENILIDSIVKGVGQNLYGISSVTSANYRSIIDPIVFLDSRQIKLENDDVVVWSSDQAMSNMEWKDGLIGCAFLKKTGTRVHFDFVNMRMSIE